MEGLTFPGEQKGYVIGRVLVRKVVGEEGRERELELPCKTILFLIQIKKERKLGAGKAVFPMEQHRNWLPSAK